MLVQAVVIPVVEEEVVDLPRVEGAVEVVPQL